METQKTETKKKPNPEVMQQAEKVLAVKGEASLSHQVTPQVQQEVLNSDIIIPKLLLMQGLSDFVADGKAKIGDMVRSTDCEHIGDGKTPIHFIPLKMTNTWTIKEKVGQKYEFRGIEARNAANEDAEWDFTKNGTDWKRIKTINVFALLPRDVLAFQAEIEKVQKEGGLLDLDKTLMPVVISFQSTSYKAGQDVATFFTKIKSNLQYDKTIAPFKYTLSLECEQTENDKGKFYIFKIGKTAGVPKEVLGESEKWYNILNAMKDIKIDVSDEGSSKEGATINVNEVSQF
jgi:hypothetical protein